MTEIIYKIRVNDDDDAYAYLTKCMEEGKDLFSPDELMGAIYKMFNETKPIRKAKKHIYS